jgi:glycosyltransferase involved in cell wall biosynthesis
MTTLLSGVSVIVNTLNDQDSIGGMLESILKSSPDQIIVVDGESNDSTVEIAKKFATEVYVVPKGIIRQQQVALDNVKYENLIVLECDHRYPENFISDLKNEFDSGDYFGLQATLNCYFMDTFWERGLNQFYIIHQVKKGERTFISGPAIWNTDGYIYQFGLMKRVQGYSADTSRAEMLQKNNKKVGLSSTIAYQYQKLSLQDFLRKFYNYGHGDYDFYSSHYKEWSLLRKVKSLTHVFVRYCIVYSLKSFRYGNPFIAIPFLWSAALVRYAGWGHKILKG